MIRVSLLLINIHFFYDFEGYMHLIMKIIYI